MWMQCYGVTYASSVGCAGRNGELPCGHITMEGGNNVRTVHPSEAHSADLFGDVFETVQRAAGSVVGA
ncbi:hypothetical protein GUJ93_ZPchr0009g822 [Zizania palustris]|uniref:Uncharacterized protein n=1 Tax=Zizania palustris TaxID=103762 RepID=A0A8J5RQD2_ZIZPA|nr:hypothetical protein GUJ93_ZPchr0009g822 [Zizania palustris]